MRQLFILPILLFSLSTTYSQIPIQRWVVVPKSADSVDIAHYSRKNGLLAGGMVFGLNMGVWAFDRYVLKEDFAYINAHTIKDNLKHGFVWDNDQMGTNMFLHPYHGSLYYNAARSNGYNYWQSGLFSFAGSAMWELFMENEYPSTNDIIATPVGGMALGEMFYRVTDLILDDRRKGKGRFGRELASFVISPMRGLTRIINGDAWRVRPTSGRQFGIPEVSVDVSAGIRALELKDEIFDRGVGFATEINIEYGDRFDSYHRKPYDYFSFKVNLNLQSSQPILGELNVIGRLLGTEIMDTHQRHLSIGLYQHFDYYDSDTISTVSNTIPYKFCSPASVGVGMMFQSRNNKRWGVDAYLHVNAIILGGALSDYYQVKDRNYNLGSGFGTKSGINFVYKDDKFAVSGAHEMYRMFTWKGYPDTIDWKTVDPNTLDAQGDKSKVTLHKLGLRFDLKLKRQIYLTGVYNNFIRDTNYDQYENVFSKTSEGRLMLTYKF